MTNENNMNLFDILIVLLLAIVIMVGAALRKVIIN